MAPQEFSTVGLGCEVKENLQREGEAVRGGLWMSMGSLCAVVSGTVHATTPRRPCKRKTVDTACGRRARYYAIKVIGQDGTDEGALVIPWPPRVADIAPDRRCRECMQLRPGKPRPRPEGPLLGFGGPRR